MEATQRFMKDNPCDSSNTVMKVLFLWTIKFFKVGSKLDLNTEDLFGPKIKDKSSRIGKELEKNWNIQKKKCQKKTQDAKKLPSLLTALFWTFKWEIFVLGLLLFFNDIVYRSCQPLLLGILLSYFRPAPLIPMEYALYAAGGLILINVIAIITVNHYIFATGHLGMRVRIAVCSLVYRKTLNLSATASCNYTPGKMVNLLSNDVNRFDFVAYFIHYLWVAPLSGLVTLTLLFQQVGLAGIIGVAVVFTVIPLQSYTGKLSAKFRLQTATRSDERIRLMYEIISGVQVIKMFTWEIPFTNLMKLARKLELNAVRKNAYVLTLFMSFQLFTTRAASFCTMAWLVLQGTQLTATTIFVFAQYFATLSFTMASMFPRAISECAEAWVSIHRLQEFLNQDEFEGHRPVDKFKSSDNAQKEINDDVNLKSEMESSVISIRISKSNAKWHKDNEECILQDIDIEILKGSFIGIIGPVGSGKSSLLQLILGELRPDSGKVQINGSISYASQEPWVFGSTVRQNILFGLPYDELRYKKTLNVCSLEEDLQSFSNGDQTLVGDKGISLSGGQKARINLARAVYREADVYLLDDPLSAVDAHVGRQLYERCVRTHLRKTTRLLVTHQLHYLTNADHIIIMRNGKIEMQGRYDSVAKSSLDYARMLTPSETERWAEGERPYSERQNSSDRCIRQRQNESRMNSESSDASLKNIPSCPNLSDMQIKEQQEFIDRYKPTIAETEKISRGVVQGSVGMHYIRAAVNWFELIIMILLFTGTQALASFFDYFVAFWISQEEKRYLNITNSVVNSSATSNLLINNRTYRSDLLDAMSDTKSLYPSHVLMVVGGVIVISILILGLWRATYFYNCCIRASQALHDLMFRGIIRSPMKFFDVTPVGRIMNRFSKDMGAVDEILPKEFLNASQQLLVLAGAVIVVSTVNPLFLAVVAAMVLVFIFLRKVYLNSSKNIKRFEGITRSPVFTHLGSTLSGLPTIRACRAQAVIQDEFDKLQDVHTSAFFMYISIMSAFGLALDVLCLLFVASVTFSFFVIGNDVLGDKVGLAITQAMSLTFLVQYGVRQSAEVANQMMAVERLVEYTQLPAERGIKPDERDARQARKSRSELPSYRTPPRGWPERGCIQFRHLSLRYAPTDDDAGWVLHDLNFVIRPCEKVGVVGRTGAGKSSLIQAMFRLADLRGEIIIDDVSTGDITLEDLRKHLSIIPQDPVLFSGTLRRNLDPFDEFSDDVLWQVLNEARPPFFPHGGASDSGGHIPITQYRDWLTDNVQPKQVELKESLTNPAGLAMHVLDGGANLSVGQRQLICLARVLLRNNRLLMMDEATANVDPHTDALLQQTIRTKFTDCTVLTIAHRLNTIMDSDKVLVMESGKIVEMDHPYLLLQKKGNVPEEDGYFRKMVSETGADSLAELELVAKDCYMKKPSSYLNLYSMSFD